MIIWRFVSIGWILATSAVLLSALFFSISRAVLPLLADYRQDIQAHLSEALDRKISIGNINARWHATTPQVKLVDVSIYDASGSRIELHMDSIFFSLDIVKSLRSGAVRVKEFGLKGCDISIVRNTDHAITIHGLEVGIPSSRNMSELGLLESFAQSKVNLIDCRIGWKDKVSSKDYFFEGVSVSVSSEEEHKRVAARLKPSAGIGGHLVVLMEFEGQLDRPSGWQGRLYIDAQDLQLEAFLPETILQEYGLRRGRLKLENWSDWQQGKPVRMRGSFSLSDLSLSLSPITVESDPLSMRGIELIQANYEWHSRTQGWHLRLGGLKTVMDGRVWPESDFSLDYQFDGDASRQFRGVADQVDLGQLTRLLRLMPGSTQLLSQDWVGLVASGGLNNARFFVSLDEASVERYHVSTRVNNLNLAQRKGIPGIGGLDGWVNISERGGEAIIESHDVTLEYPEAFANKLSADYLSAVLTWFSQDGNLYMDSESLRIGNEDIDVVGGGRLILGEGSPHIDVKLSYGHGNGANLQRYLPKKIMPPKIYEWLVRSIKEVYINSGTTVIRGKASEFPFVAGNGVFEASAVLERGMLDYKPGWPKLDDIHANLVFRGQSMEIANARASVLNSELNGVTVAIDDLKQAELKLQAEIKGPLSDVWQYSSHTVLPKDDKRIVKDLWLGGNSRMNLEINLPLSALILDKEKVAGELFLSGATLGLQQPNVKIEDITGKLSFGPQGAKGQGIKATIHGRSVMISARPNAPLGTVIEVQGRLGVEDLVQNVYGDSLRTVIGRSLTGVSDWLAQVAIPHSQLANDNRKIGIRMWSDLRGIEVNMPEPFMKPADKQEAFFIGTELGTDGTLPLQIRYGKHLSVALSMRKSGDDYSLMGGEARFYRGEAAVPVDGIKILGTLPRCSLTAWHSWFQRVVDLDQQHEYGRGIRHMPLNVDVSFDHLELAGHEFEEMSFSTEKQGDTLHLKVNSQAIKGDMVMPQPVASNAPIRVNLDYLKLPDRLRTSGSSVIDPRRIPALRIKSKALHYGDIELGELYLNTNPRQDGMTINDIHLYTKDFSVRLNGQWISPQEQVHHTTLELMLDSGNFGTMMQKLNLTKGFESGTARITAELQYPAALYRWGYRGLTGNAHVVLQEGQFGEFEPGPWRVLGVMNINALSRRLALNFNDLLKKGFSYDSIDGNFDIEGSDVYTNDLLIKGPSADLVITGRMGLETRDYDQNVSVTSKVSTGVTVAGALLGGIGVGAAIFVADKIINTMGGSIDNVTRLNYKVTGTWDEPKIELISPATPDDTPIGIMGDDIG